MWPELWTNPNSVGSYPSCPQRCTTRTSVWNCYSLLSTAIRCSALLFAAQHDHFVHVTPITLYVQQSYLTHNSEFTCFYSRNCLFRQVINKVCTTFFEGAKYKPPINSCASLRVPTSLKMPGFCSQSLEAAAADRSGNCPRCGPRSSPSHGH